MILYIFFIILILFFLLPTVLFSFIANILSVFGLGRKKSVSKRKEANWNGERDNKTADFNDGNNSARKKIFDKNEGEYVDFEEIK